ncbi:MAG: dTDP-4-dehydrorhamnose 3,5-epimerase [Actinomycetes bacterium]
MELIPTRLDGPLLIEPRVFGDSRGFFTETFRSNLFSSFGITEPMLQQNHSRSTFGVVRGMHFHTGDGVSKLISCVRGEILDVLVDIRRASPTFGEWEGFALDDRSLRTLYAPVGFAHGFCVLSEVADVTYQQSAYYSADVETGFSPNDPDVAIEWPIAADQQLISERDVSAPTLAAIADSFDFA